MEVETYQLSNRLKRTTTSFFDHLHTHTTASWNNKLLDEKDKVEEEGSCLSPTMTNVLSHRPGFKGSFWKSGSHCEASAYRKQLKA